jgi:hypothetical protein
MNVPAIARGTPTLLEMEGMLGMWCLRKRVMKIWVLQDYESEVWSLKREFELPITEHWSNIFLSSKRDMLVYSVGTCLHQIHYDDNGKLLEEFKLKTKNCKKITMQWFKESLFFPRQGGEHVSQPQRVPRL